VDETPSATIKTAALDKTGLTKCMTSLLEFLTQAHARWPGNQVVQQGSGLCVLNCAAHIRNFSDWSHLHVISAPPCSLASRQGILAEFHVAVEPRGQNRSMPAAEGDVLLI
jgi:hypothetical protein